MKSGRQFNNKANITNRELKQEFMYKNQAVVGLEIIYPHISLTHGTRVQRRINRIYQGHAKQFYLYAKTTMYKNAVENYRMALENNFPFHMHEAVMKYTVTLNDNCRLSTYFDQYQFTGGAHGNTYRFSDNFNLQTGQKITMESLFGGDPNYRDVVIKQIMIEAEKNLIENPGIYFPNYKELIVENFNPNSFNLTPTGIMVYYQQYDIAPYSTGIVEFNLSYRSLGIEKPRCV